MKGLRRSPAPPPPGAQPNGSPGDRLQRFSLLYWFGLLVGLGGVMLRFWTRQIRLGLVLAIAGVAMLLAARAALALQRGRRPRNRN